MKLERNRAERRAKKGAQILYKGIPFLIFAALAAGFLMGVTQATAVSAIDQASKNTVTRIEKKRLVVFPIGYIGKTNSVLSSSFTEEDFTYSGSYTWLDDGDGDFRIKFTTSGNFVPLKKLKIDLFLVGGGSGGRSANPRSLGGGGGAGGITGTWLSISLIKGQSYPIIIGGGGGNNSDGGTTLAFECSAAGGIINPVSKARGGSGGSGGGGANSGVGGSDGSDGGGSYAGTGQGTTTREFGDSTGELYAGAGGAGAGEYTYMIGGNGGAGGGAKGGNGGGYNGSSAAANTGGGGGGGGSDDDDSVGNGGSGGSGIVIIRNARA